MTKMSPENAPQEKWFFDARSLALFRLGLAAILVCFACREVTTWEHAYFLGFFIPAGLLFLGLGTRMVLAALVLLSLAFVQTRPLLCASFIQISLWSCFIPLSARLSLDRALRRFPLTPADDQRGPENFTSPALWGLSFQLVAVALMNWGQFPDFLLWLLLLLILFIPTGFWNWLHRAARRPEFLARQSQLKGYYDNDCGFCRRMLAMIRELFGLPAGMFAPAQADPETHRLMEEHNTWILRAGDQTYFAFEGFARVLAGSPLARILPRPLVRLVRALLLNRLVLKIGNRIYQWIAEHRMLLGPPLAKLKPGEFWFELPRQIRFVLWGLMIIPLLEIWFFGSRILNL